MSLTLGTIYNGDFKDGAMAGRGKLAIASEKTELSNNETYVGQFEDNLYDGKTKLLTVQDMEST